MKSTEITSNPVPPGLGAIGANIHPYVTKMLGQTHAQEYVNSVKNFIDTRSLNEMFDTLEKSSHDHFDPDDPLDTKRRGVEERAGRSGHVSEWDEKRWGQWLTSQHLDEFVDKNGMPAFVHPNSGLSVAFKS